MTAISPVAFLGILSPAACDWFFPSFLMKMHGKRAFFYWKSQKKVTPQSLPLLVCGWWVDCDRLLVVRGSVQQGHDGITLVGNTIDDLRDIYNDTEWWPVVDSSFVMLVSNASIHGHAHTNVSRSFLSLLWLVSGIFSGIWCRSSPGSSVDLLWVLSGRLLVVAGHMGWLRFECPRFDRRSFSICIICEDGSRLCDWHTDRNRTVHAQLGDVRIGLVNMVADGDLRMGDMGGDVCLLPV